MAEALGGMSRMRWWRQMCTPLPSDVAHASIPSRVVALPLWSQVGLRFRVCMGCVFISSHWTFSFWPPATCPRGLPRCRVANSLAQGRSVALDFVCPDRLWSGVPWRSGHTEPALHTHTCTRLHADVPTSVYRSRRVHPLARAVQPQFYRAHAARGRALGCVRAPCPESLAYHGC